MELWEVLMDFMRLGRVATVALAFSLGLPSLINVQGRADDEVLADTATSPMNALFHPPKRLAAADGIIDCGPSWGHAGPWVADVDDDGKNDLVVGDFSGLFRFYRNEGSNQQPRYAKAVNIQAGGQDAKVPIY